MRVCDLIKDQDTYRADVNQTVMDVAKAMVERNIGAAAVLSEGLLVGIFSERDLMRRIVDGINPATTRLFEVMTADPLTVSPDEDPETCMLLMRRHGFRHLPVCEGKQLRGMISMRDLILHGLTEKDEEVRMMRAYIQTGPDVGA
jgi:CBS domain-containing protein